MGEVLFATCVAFLVALSFAFLVMMDGPKPPTFPTESELFVLERVAKIVATAQGECK